MKETISHVIDAVDVQTELLTCFTSLIDIRHQNHIGHVDMTRMAVTTVWITSQRTHYY